MTLQADTSMNLSADLHNRLRFGFINRRRIGRIRDWERVFFSIRRGRFSRETSRKCDRKGKTLSRFFSNLNPKGCEGINQVRAGLSDLIIKRISGACERLTTRFDCATCLYTDVGILLWAFQKKWPKRPRLRVLVFHLFGAFLTCGTSFNSKQTERLWIWRGTRTNVSDTWRITRPQQPYLDINREII